MPPAPGPLDSSFDARDVLAHAGGVRALACRLLRSDPALADDLAQEVCLSALGRPAVGGLEEPYRTVVLERFFEGRSARAIARLQGVPLATVKTRLTRALALLRRALDREHGGERLERPSRQILLSEYGELVMTKARGASVGSPEGEGRRLRRAPSSATGVPRKPWSPDSQPIRRLAACPRPAPLKEKRIMNIRRLVPTVFVCLLAGALATAQKEAPAQPQVKAIPAAAPLVRGKLKSDLTLTVTGLTDDNAKNVKAALEGMKGDLHVCGGCKAEFAKAGDCPTCKMPLTASKEVVLGMVTIHADKNQIVLQTKEGMELKLSSLQRILLADTVKIDDKKLMLPGSFTLLVSGAPSADQAKAIETALSEAKLFQSAHAEAGPMGVRIHVIANATAQDLTHVREVVTKAGPSFQITDVIWNAWSIPTAG